MTEQCLPPNCNSNAHHPLVDGLITWSQRKINTVNQWLLERKQHRLNRQTFKSLAPLDESTLKDIGLSRGDVTWASKLPSSIDASSELEIISRRKPRPSR